MTTKASHPSQSRSTPNVNAGSGDSLMSVFVKAHMVTAARTAAAPSRDERTPIDEEEASRAAIFRFSQPNRANPLTDRWICSELSRQLVHLAGQLEARVICDLQQSLEFVHESLIRGVFYELLQRR